MDPEYMKKKGRLEIYLGLGGFQKPLYRMMPKENFVYHNKTLFHSTAH